MKVRVERTIIEREKNASSCARRLVQGYSRVFHSQLRTSLHTNNTNIQIILHPSPCHLLPDGTVPEVLLLRGLHRLDLGTQVHVLLILAEVHLRKVLESTASLCKSMVN